MAKLKVATCSLAGCFGCHMSLLDIDEKLFELVKAVEFDRSPITDIKHCGPCDIGIVEGGKIARGGLVVVRVGAQAGDHGGHACTVAPQLLGDVTPLVHRRHHSNRCDGAVTQRRRGAVWRRGAVVVHAGPLTRVRSDDVVEDGVDLGVEQRPDERRRSE